MPSSFQYASSIHGYRTNMHPNKIYVNPKCAVSLANKQMSIQELIFMTKSYQTYYNLKSSISLSNTQDICLNIYLIIIVITITIIVIIITIFLKCSSILPHLCYLSNLSKLEADLKTQQLFSFQLLHLCYFSVF